VVDLRACSRTHTPPDPPLSRGGEAIVPSNRTALIWNVVAGFIGGFEHGTSNMADVVSDVKLY
jgi:hypothetical protein